jgi:hypothetical protein
MSKLGVHVSAGNRTGFGDYLKKCAEAGSPVPVVYSVDQDLWPDVHNLSPKTILVFRNQPRTKDGEGLDGAQGAYHTDPIQSAQDWMKSLLPSWEQNKADYYSPINEQDAPDLAGFKWLNDFTLECQRIAGQHGYKLALYGFSSGNPKDDVIVNGQPHPDGSTLEQKWAQLLPSMQEAKRRGDILLLHEYGFGSPTLKASAPHLALRYRRSLHYLWQNNADIKLVISEASAGAGGWGGLPGGLSAWLDDVKWYDSKLMEDDGVIGCCLYQVGGAENISTALPKLADYVSKTPTITPIGFPVVWDASTAIPTPITPTPPGDRPDDDSSTTVLPPVTGDDSTLTPPTPTDTTPPNDDTSTPGPVDDTVSPPTPTDTTTTIPPSAGPLDFNVRLVGCRKDPDRKNNVILTFEIDVTGGNGVYTYMREGETLDGSRCERAAGRNGSIVDAYRVTSGDGQSVEKKFFFASRDFPC